MDQCLRELENAQTDHQVEELSAIEPILRKIADDPSLMHISRQSAQHLLKTISASGAATTSSIRHRTPSSTPMVPSVAFAISKAAPWTPGASTSATP